MEYIRADKLPFDPRPQMGRIFAEGFYQWLTYFSKDKEKLARAMAHIFDLSYFFAATQDNEIMAITACTNGKTPPVKLDKKTLCRTLGFISGRIAYTMLTKHLVNHPYPFEVPPQTGSIEFVATAAEHRGKGAAHGLIVHIMETMPYAEYALEVADNNTPAVKLYEKLGFVEFMRTPAPKQGGFSHLVYMKKNMKLKERAKQLKTDIPAVFLALKREETPLFAKIIAAVTVAYALSPIDFIPDFIPVIGFLDDVILLPALVALVIKLIPAEVFADCRKEAAGLWSEGKPKRWYYTLPIILIWGLIIFVIIKEIWL